MLTLIYLTLKFHFVLAEWDTSHFLTTSLINIHEHDFDMICIFVFSLVLVWLGLGLGLGLGVRMELFPILKSGE